jgi:hypothetical protein
MAKGGPKTGCRRRKFGWLRGESKVFMQKKFKVAGSDLNLRSRVTSCGIVISQGQVAPGRSSLRDRLPKEQVIIRTHSLIEKPALGQPRGWPR